MEWIIVTNDNIVLDGFENNIELNNSVLYDDLFISDKLSIYLIY